MATLTQDPAFLTPHYGLGQVGGARQNFALKKQQQKGKRSHLALHSTNTGRAQFNAAATDTPLSCSAPTCVCAGGGARLAFYPTNSETPPTSTPQPDQALQTQVSGSGLFLCSPAPSPRTSPRAGSLPALPAQCTRSRNAGKRFEPYSRVTWPLRSALPSGESRGRLRWPGTALGAPGQSRGRSGGLGFLTCIPGTWTATGEWAMKAKAAPRCSCGGGAWGSDWLLLRG